MVDDNMRRRRRRYSSCDVRGFLLPPVLLLSVCFSFLSLHVPMAAGAGGAAPPPPPLNSTQESVMNGLSRSLAAVAPSPPAATRWDTSDSNPCRWRGVRCSASGSFSAVTGLDLSGYGMSNATTIFASICSLDTLRTLDLSKNSFADLTARLSPCPMNAGLLVLNFSSNRLAGQIGDLSSYARLEVLDLSFNSFSGVVTNQLSDLPKLRSLNFSSNNLVGAVPATMASSIEEFVLSGNGFSDPIPSGVFSYNNLTLLDLSQNNLTGDVLDEFSRLPNLRTLLLSGNHLTGAIPKSLSNVTTLFRFAANQNNFTGSIPSGITRHLKMLDLSYNHLDGEIPSDLLGPADLETVDLSSNSLEGPIPRNLSLNLYRLRLGGNKLNATIPDTIGDVLALAYLELDKNQLIGSIPSELGKCKNLSLLNLASNKLQGQVPDAIGSLDKLVVLKLQMNNLSGPIPSTFSNFPNMNTLNLSQNSFSGEIPLGIFNLSKLSSLNFQGNKIGGAIPSSVGSLQSLIELDFGNNSLTGTIPTMPAKLSTVLNLSHNHLSGPIPLSLGFLTDLEILDLSYNNLSGPVPSSLGVLTSLTQLVLSYNHLNGSLPAFNPSVTVDSTGNPDLTNGTGNNNIIPASSKRRTHNVVIIVFAIAGAVVGLCLLAAIVMLLLSKKIYRVEDEGPSDEMSVAQVVDSHLITMNSIHTSSISFTYAMEAVSLPSNIFLKTRFCTYYKAVMPNGTSYTVKKLDWSDKIFQIGGREKFGHELEVLGKLSNSNVMVPLAYALTQDNAYLLYEHACKDTVFDLLHGGKPNVLDWPSRYSIALGVAQGLTFLHGCTQPVLLLDMSTRTIHLKSVNEPQIGDIELYKIIDPSKSSGSLSTIAGTVGYIPPEYAYTMRLTMAGNVYSFGVILLELLTGKPSVSDGMELAKWALSLSARPEQREQVLDTRLSRASVRVHSQMLSVLKIALACVAFSPDARPKMRNVSRLLANAK